MKKLLKLFPRLKKYWKKISASLQKTVTAVQSWLKKHYYQIALGSIIICTVIAGIALMARYFVKAYQETIRNAETVFHFGAIGDFEYGTRISVGNKLTRQSRGELEKVIEFYNNEYHPTFAIELGDMIESSGLKPEKAKQQFRDIDAVFRTVNARTEYVLGNHDLRSLSKAEVREILGLEGNHRIFSEGDWRFVITDTNFDKDNNDADMGPDHFTVGYIPKSEYEWLEDAITTDQPTIVFSHHPIAPGLKNTRNYEEIRALFERHPNVVLSISGHDPSFRFSEANGIHYLVVDNLASRDSLGSFATLDTFYNPLTKEAKVMIEHYGPTRRTVEAKKIISAERFWWVDTLDRFKLLP